MNPAPKSLGKPVASVRGERPAADPRSTAVTVGSRLNEGAVAGERGAAHRVLALPWAGSGSAQATNTGWNRLCGHRVTQEKAGGSQSSPR